MKIKNFISLALGVLALAAMGFVIYLLSDINFIMLKKIFPLNGEFTEKHFRLHSYGFALATIAILMNFKGLLESLTRQQLFVSGLFALADGLITVLAFNENLLNGQKLTFYDFGALFYASYVMLIMFTLGIAVHDFIKRLPDLLQAFENKQTKVQTVEAQEVQAMPQTEKQAQKALNKPKKQATSNKTQQVLELVEKGKNQPEIALILGITQQAVSYHINKAKHNDKKRNI